MFSEFFIKRPVFSAVTSIVILLTGLASMINLPIEEYPRVIPPQIIVSTNYPGASADTISKTVAAPLEEQINGANDMIYMSSTSADNGKISINVFFKVGKDANNAKIDVNNRVQAALAKLPEEVQRQGVTVRERSPSMLEVIMLYSPDNSRDITYLSNYALINVADDLKRVQGVGDATIFGQKDYAIRVWIDPQKLAKQKLTTKEVVNAIKDQNEQYAAGKFAAEPLVNKQMFTYTIQTPTRLSNPKEFGNIVIRANEDGSSLRLKDVSTIELGSQSYDMKTALNGNPSIPIGIFLQNGANALDTANAIDKVLEKAKKSFPQGVTYKIPYDTTSFVKISIKEVVKTFIEAIILVIAIIFLFLQNWRATLIPILAVPVSIIGAFAGMYALGFSINLLTLFGLVLAIGIVVDDAIIVIENVERHMSEGMSPRDASFKAMKEVSGALIAIVLVLCSVFIPVAFMGGLTGEMYRQFAITIVISIIVSGFVALTLTPSLCATILKDDHVKPKGFFKWFNDMFEKITHGYSFVVQKTIRYSLISILLFGGLIFISYDLFKDMKTGLVPQEDKGYIILFSYNPPGSSLSRTDKLVKEITNVVTSNENVSDIITLAGLDLVTSASRTYAATSFIRLNDWSERKRPDQHATVIANKFNGQLMGATSDGFTFGVLPPPIMGMSISGGFDMYVQDRTGGTVQDLSKYVNKIIAKANKRPELQGVRTTLNVNIPQFKVTVDVDKAKAKGINVADIYNTLSASFGTYYVNDFNLYGRTYKVDLQAKADFRKSPQDLKFILVKSNKGELIPISSLVKVVPTVGSDVVERFNLFPAAKVSGQPALGYSSGDALKAIEEVSKEVLPEGYTISWVGTAYQEKQISSSSLKAFVFGVVLLFLILAAQYERWLMPISVVLAVPFAIFGAILATLLRGLENDIYFQVGLLVLAGLAAKNAILIVEFAIQKQKEGLSLKEAAVTAAKIRLRPIIMTSLAFTLGVIPLAISSGAGAGSRHSIGTGVIGGMLSATFLAILFIPLFYILVSKLSKKHNK
ncbi:efflux RND transporter permease subunit [Arcobacter sp. CECT 8985]|uniref:efflux RND transporter permease subunit n=1 Tax=Arcobacter sp. CECT 8985 TaxID=1935424 RepID=UPI00100BEB94|nr:multidrug efflux RND transporter permease subunit [Arcobacter sp. CECT 8985]RXJ88046.1 hydrophobe/amphiphile efflux-1 family RND transporter [Arcobacter sp. CECT 8985]